MTPTDDDLRKAWRASATSRSRSACPSTEVLTDVAFGDQAESSVIEHLSGCEACAAEVRAIRDAAGAADALERFPATPSKGASDLAIAALIVLTVGLSAWVFVSLGRTAALEKRIAELQRKSQRVVPAPAPPAPAETKPEPAAYVNVAIVDLEPEGDAIRGATASAVPVDLPDAEAYAFVMTIDPSGRHDDYALEVVDGNGKTILARTGLRRSADDTFTIGAERALFPNRGVHRIDLFAVGGSTRTKLQSYLIRVP